MIETEIKCDGLMARLGEEMIESYDTGDSGAAIGDIVTDLLALQRKATKITEGTIAATGTVALSATNKTILSALIQLHGSIGGYIYVDNDWKLQWPTTIGADTGQQIRFRKNLKGIHRDLNYGGFCTKLHPASADESLSDISLGPVDVDTDTDATYGYITLKETYAAYLGWTAVGEALPANVTVWKKNNAPSEITPSNGSGAGWTNVTRIYDGSWGPLYAASAAGSGVGTYSSWGGVDIASASYESLRVKTDDGVNRLDGMQIEIYDGADWTQIYDGSEYKNDALITFAVQTVEKIRFRAKYGVFSDNLEVYEIHAWEADITDDTVNWLCGADEHTVRCAIADWDAGATYQISYTYADYLMAWDKITTNDDIVARLVTNKYESYSLSLLDSSILILDELKVVPTTYDIDTIDLSQNEDFDFSFDALVIGSQVQVIDEDLGIDVNVRVVKIEHPDLLYPERMQIQLSTRVRDISDYLADLHKEF